MQTRGGLRMDRFSQLLRGGDSGAIITPGRGEQSLLVQKLRGMVGERMPAGGRPALPESSIELITTWINEGATLDGADENQPLRTMAQLAWASRATDEERSARRAELAEAKLNLVANSGAPAEAVTTPHFHIIGHVPESALGGVGKIAEEQLALVRGVAPGQRGEAYFHGRATLFVLPKRYDYSEFARMAESRSVPAEWTSHWSFDGISAYVALVATDQDDDETLAARLAGPLVSLAVATRGVGVPRWFADGAGVATAGGEANRGDRGALRKEQTELMEALAAMTKPSDFLEGELSPEQSDRIGAAIMRAMTDRSYRRQFETLMRGLNAGVAFDEAFQRAFRGTPEQFVQTWMQWAKRG